MLERYMPFRVPTALCDEMLKVAALSTKQTAGLEGYDEPDPERRSTEICWLGHDWYDGVMTDFGMTANTKWGLDVTGGESIQVGWYAPGGHYKMHSDVNPFDPSKGYHRKVTIVLCLVDDYEGGDLQLDGCDPIRLKKGEGVVFPSLLAHAVHPVTSGERVTAVKWLTGPFYR